MDEQDEWAVTPVVSGRRVGAEKLARAKDLRRAMPPTDRMLWEALRANRLASLHFRRQQVIAGFIVDFYCHTARVAIELDGPVHQRTGDYDTARDELLQAQGLFVLRFTNDQVMAARSDVLAQIAEVCALRRSPSDQSHAERPISPSHLPRSTPSAEVPLPEGEGAGGEVRAQRG